VLSRAGIPVSVNVAPVIPGLTDHELPSILEAAAEAGAISAGYILLRLPHGVKLLFDTWLEQHFPDRKDKVLNRLLSLHDGELYDSAWGRRKRGGGPYAEQIRRVFEVARRKAGLEGPGSPLSTAGFRRSAATPQTDLFE
jgi:DNA repair photolyase